MDDDRYVRGGDEDDETGGDETDDGRYVRGGDEDDETGGGETKPLGDVDRTLRVPEDNLC